VLVPPLVPPWFGLSAEVQLPVSVVCVALDPCPVVVVHVPVLNSLPWDGLTAPAGDAAARTPKANTSVAMESLFFTVTSWKPSREQSVTRLRCHHGQAFWVALSHRWHQPATGECPSRRTEGSPSQSTLSDNLVRARLAAHNFPSAYCAPKRRLATLVTLCAGANTHSGIY
jgi:hypothetical protein